MSKSPGRGRGASLCAPNRNTSLVQGRVPDSSLDNLTPHPGAISKRWPPPMSERCRGRVRLPHTQASHVKRWVVCLAGSSPTPLTADSAGRSAVAFQRMPQAGAMSVQPRVPTTTLGSFANLLATSVSPSLTRPCRHRSPGARVNLYPGARSRPRRSSAAPVALLRARLSGERVHVARTVSRRLRRCQ
jgi:hypothetical protein